MNYMSVYNEWLHYANSETLNELRPLSEREKEDRFYTELTFGTAGLRGLIGAGTNRMNIYVVRRATAGLCAYLNTLQDAKSRGVVIAYDSRTFSAEFALASALVLTFNGYNVYLFSAPRPVPELSFTLRNLNAIAGIVITASHNPKEYNGYKVYAEYGGQLDPEGCKAVFLAMQKIEYFDVNSHTEAEAKESGLLNYIGAKEDDAYIGATLTTLTNPGLLTQYGNKLKIVYTPLHGTGLLPMQMLFNRAGITLNTVNEQANPDPDFPTVKVPNPESKSAFELAISLAKKTGAELILATDPDADRLGVAIRNNDGEYIILSGNQAGCMMLNHILREAANTNGVAVKSIVSTQLANAICAHYNVELREVLTGFLYISKIVEECAKSNREFLFGFEESCGYLSVGHSRDKDALNAALLFAELYADCLHRSTTLYDELLSLYADYGYYYESAKSYTLMGKAGMEKIRFTMEALRSSPPMELSCHDARDNVGENKAFRTVFFEDYLSDLRLYALGNKERINIPRADMLRIWFEGDSYIVIRPSGTEPKLKVYLGVKGRSHGEAEKLIMELKNAALSYIENLLEL